MAQIITLLPRVELLDRLRAALRLASAGGARHRLLPLGSWTEAERESRAGAVHLVIFDPCGGEGVGPRGCVAFHRRFPSVALLPYGDFSRTHARDLLRLADVGVRDLVVSGEDDGAADLVHRIGAVLAGGVPDRVLAGLDERFPDTLRPIMWRILSATTRPLSPREAAALCHRHPNTLWKQLRQGALPSLSRLIGWARLFHAAHLLEDPDRSVENVALALEFPSAAALRNQFRRYAGLTPQEVRAGGGVSLLVTVFEAWLEGWAESGEPAKECAVC